MRKSLSVLLFLACCPLLLAQQALTNDGVIKLVKAGLSDDLIVSTINGSVGQYDTSADGIIALKTAGVGDKVVAAIVMKASAPVAAYAPIAAPGTAPAAGDPDDPASPHDPGVYLMETTHDGKQKMVFMDRAASGNEKTSGILAHAFTYGIVQAKIKASIPGARAILRTQDERPVFYMYFPPIGNQGGLGGTDLVTSPAQFSLISLENKKDHRETSVEKIGFAAASVGDDQKRLFLFTSERIRPYAYRVVPNGSLKAGEFAFIASTRMAGSATGGTVIIYDFGVDLK
jgi:hypothetical protein